jgi:maltose alpha-D-glucosyltransferase / alpha-amylase
MINDLWYKNSIVYCLSVGIYMDANGDVEPANAAAFQ